MNLKTGRSSKFNYINMFEAPKGVRFLQFFALKSMCSFVASLLGCEIDCKLCDIKVCISEIANDCNSCRGPDTVSNKKKGSGLQILEHPGKEKLSTYLEGEQKIAWLLGEL